MPKPFLAGNCDARPIGTRVIDSTPAAITISMDPDITACAAKCNACCDEPHWRSIEVPGTLSGSFEAMMALRAMLLDCSPACITQPMMTSSIWSGAAPDQIEDVIMGCVMQAGEQSNNIARNAIMASKLPESVPGTSIDRQCGSSQQALHFAAQAVMSGTMDIVIAAGVESMTRVPMGLASQLPAKNGFGTYKSPGIEKRYPNIVFSQFTGAEMMAEKYGLSRDDLDKYAYESHQRAIAATQAGKFRDEIIPLQITRADGSTDTHHIDEGIRFDATLDGLQGVKLIAENGKLTAASASQICDGASGVLVVNEKGLKSLGVKPMARIHHMTMMGGDPVIMLDAPLHATERALKKAGMSIDDIDLFEVNEAFASVPAA